MSRYYELQSVLRNGHPNVVVVGGGYVGLPLAIMAEEERCNVTILEVDEGKVADINAGIAPEGFPSFGVKATLDPACQVDADIIIVCVPTPLNKNREPDLTALNSVVERLVDNLPREQALLVIESTVYPGYTQELASKLPSSLWVAFSSERINPGTPFETLPYIPKVTGGCGQEALDLAVDFYRRLFVTVVPVESPTVAEMSKLLENSFRAVNIALVNELSCVCKPFGIDVSDVIDAAATKPFGFMPFRPGPGIGGHCIPVDPYYLLWALSQKGFEMPLLESAMMSNREMPDIVLWKVKDIAKGKNVLVIGVAYKEDVPDVRESPALVIIAKLIDAGYHVSYHDSLVPELKEFGMTSVDLDERKFDLGVLVTNHSSLDVPEVLSACSVVLDTRRVLPRDERIVRL